MQQIPSSEANIYSVLHQICEIKNKIKCKILRSHSDAEKESRLLGCYATATGK